MSDVLSLYKSKTYQWEISTTDPPLTYLKQRGVSRFEIAPAIKIPYPLLKIWHDLVCDEYDYIDFLNASVLGKKWFQVSRATGHRVQQRLEREAGVISNKYRQTKGRKKAQLNDKYLTVSILLHELLSFEHLQEELDSARNEISEWKTKCTNLEEEKEKLVREIQDVLRKKEEEIVELETAEEELRNYVDMLEKQSGLLCEGRKVGGLGPKQRSRKVLKERAQCALPSPSA